MSGKRRLLTLKEKIDIVETYNKEKLSVRDLSKRFNIGKTQAAGIVKSGSELLSKWQSNVNTGMKRSFLKPMGLNIDKFCYDWFVKARNKGFPLSAEDDLPLSTLSDIWKTFEEIGIDCNDLDEFINIDTNLILEDDNDLVSADYIPAQTETANISDDSDEEAVIISNQTNNVTHYQQAIRLVKDLQEFSKNKGDSSAMEMLSDLELHFQDGMFKTKTCQTTLFEFFSVP
ncbi:hypothetical protein NQ314_001301 [Rhamnusium bicolor]|uniref:HTH psq-type domain-containing protein n=1 Tax=Rhamnusium bicolor TaxID=1586634 RepID=A0AAV8ZTM2_9CUCU|nr:hypothetical protein NQ314_001301 [Rhamnusium bicolor]